jgi:hypothetical protein
MMRGHDDRGGKGSGQASTMGELWHTPKGRPHESHTDTSAHAMDPSCTGGAACPTANNSDPEGGCQAGTHATS